MKGYRVFCKAGAVRNGYGSDRGAIFHYVREDGQDDSRALCGTSPGKFWSGWPHGENWPATCPKCLNAESRGAGMRWICDVLEASLTSAQHPSKSNP